MIDQISNHKSIQSLLEAQGQVANLRSDTIVYTVNFGNYDNLSSPKNDPSVAYVCFHDSSSKVPPGWIGVLVDKLRNAWIQSRAFKCLPHILFPNSAYSLYVDSSFIFRQPASIFITEKCVSPFTAFIHPNRKSIYEEILECQRCSKGSHPKLTKFADTYDSLLSSSDYLMASGGVLFRSHSSEKLNSAMELWFSFLILGVDRDQIALPVALLKLGQPLNFLHENIYYNRYLVPKPHAGAKLTFRLKWIAGQIAYSYFGYRRNTVNKR